MKNCDLTLDDMRRIVAAADGPTAPKFGEYVFADVNTKQATGYIRTTVDNLTTPVIVTTDKRGVVFGYTSNVKARPIILTNARMCLYWSADVGGVFGLAEKGPTKDCKISAVAPSITLEGVTAVFSVDPDAETAWKNAKVQGR
jgi:hypothetical protein